METRPPYITQPAPDATATAQTTPPDQPFSEWCEYRIVPNQYSVVLQGYGHISEARIGAAEFLRIVDLGGRITYYAPGQITAIVPDTEQEIRRLALGNPVTLNRLPVSSTQ